MAKKLLFFLNYGFAMEIVDLLSRLHLASFVIIMLPKLLKYYTKVFGIKYL
jgi:hypothetical protein